MRPHPHLNRFGNVNNRVALHEEPLFGEVRLEELVTAHRVLLKHQRRFVTAPLVVSLSDLVCHFLTHVERLEQVRKLLDGHESIRASVVKPILLLVLARRHLIASNAKHEAQHFNFRLDCLHLSCCVCPSTGKGTHW